MLGCCSNDVLNVVSTFRLCFLVVHVGDDLYDLYTARTSHRLQQEFRAVCGFYFSLSLVIPSLVPQGTGRCFPTGKAPGENYR